MNELTIAMKQVVTFSSQLTTWALSVLAGSIATIISTSYIRPKDIRYRLSYLLFIPGWACLSISIYLGEQITRKYLAYIMVKSEYIQKIASGINDVFSQQRLYFLTSLVFFGCWLLIFLLQWVFLSVIAEEKK
jgi:hypothetical protein